MGTAGKLTTAVSLRVPIVSRVLRAWPASSARRGSVKTWQRPRVCRSAFQRATILFLIRSLCPASSAHALSDPPAPEPPDAAAEAPAPLTGPLLPVDQAELASALAYGLRFDERGRPRRGAAWEMAATLLAEQLVAQLERARFVVLKRPPRPPHST